MRAPALALLLTAGMSCAAAETGESETRASVEASAEAAQASEDLASLCQPFLGPLEVVPYVELSVYSGVFESVWDEQRYHGCEIRFETNDSIRGGAVVPGFDAIDGSEMQRLGWRPSTGIGADGPGSGVFGIEKDTVACIVRWAQPAYIDDDGEFVESETLNMTIQCREM